MPRPRTIATGAFILLLATAPFLPRGAGDERSLLPSGQDRYAARPTEAAGSGAVTPTMQAEIDRVVDQGLALGRLTGKRTADGLVSGLVRCAEFEGQRYCLDSGWTESSQAEVRSRMTVAARTIASRPARASQATGDLDVLASLRQKAALTPSARAAADRAELTRAARSVAKVWLLRHEIEGVPLPAGFLDAHPEARASVAAPARSSATGASPSAAATRATAPAARRKTQADYPRRRAILDTDRVMDQTRTYYCGPTTMQMIAWGWTGGARSQNYWASRLHTTTSGTGISSMVSAVNRYTGWDRRDHAGPYVVLDIGGYSFSRWMLLNMRHIVDYHAPLVFHPILLKRYYPYLDDDASGHFQVGRGYDKRGSKPTAISYFEPWNQQRFDPSEPYIRRVQWRLAYKSYRANRAHFQHNIGV